MTVTELGHLIDRLAAVARAACRDREPAHDALHVMRVARAARAIASVEGAHVDVCVAAALLHEQFNYPKSHPESHRSGEVCAEHAKRELESVGWPAELVEPVCYAIRVHGFSAGIVPETLEGRILQDSDRLDAIGAIGVARCFATAADMKSLFYHPEDPFCRRREPDDRSFAVDHFYRKLLEIPERLHTGTARAMARRRIDFLNTFIEELRDDIGL